MVHPSMLCIGDKRDVQDDHNDVPLMDDELIDEDEQVDEHRS